MNADQVKKDSIGQWESITPEIRPGSTKNEDGTLKPFYLKRKFTLNPDDTFELDVTNLADPYANVPIVKIVIKGHIEWKGEHPIAKGAQKVDFSADIEYSITPLLQSFADILNKFTKNFNE